MGRERGGSAAEHARQLHGARATVVSARARRWHTHGGGSKACSRACVRARRATASAERLLVRRVPRPGAVEISSQPVVGTASSEAKQPTGEDACGGEVARHDHDAALRVVTPTKPSIIACPCSIDSLPDRAMHTVRERWCTGPGTCADSATEAAGRQQAGKRELELC